MTFSLDEILADIRAKKALKRASAIEEEEQALAKMITMSSLKDQNSAVVPRKSQFSEVSEAENVGMGRSPLILGVPMPAVSDIMAVNSRELEAGQLPDSRELQKPRELQEARVLQTPDEVQEPMQQQEPTYCICNEPTYGTMVDCHSPSCTKKKFHVICVGLKKVPDEQSKWTCPDCTKQSPTKKTTVSSPKKTKALSPKVTSPKAISPNLYVPAKRVRKPSTAVYTKKEIIDTKQKLADWYKNTNTNQKHNRGELQEVQYIRTIIDKCIQASCTFGGELDRHTIELRTRLHEMEFFPFITALIVKRSKVLENEGLPQIFEGPYKNIFPWDIAVDAEALWIRWISGDLDNSLIRGTTTIVGHLENGKKRRSYQQDKAYQYKTDSNMVGANDLVIGQWWPSRLCAIRDGAHGHHEAGIYGQAGKGAYSIVVAAGGYADKDHGDVIEYCGTASSTTETTPSTKLLEQAFATNQPIRVLRAAIDKSLVYAPKQGLRYDGPYNIVSGVLLNAATAMYRFTLRRQAGQYPIRYQGWRSDQRSRSWRTGLRFGDAKLEGEGRKGRDEM